MQNTCCVGLAENMERTNFSLLFVFCCAPTHPPKAARGAEAMDASELHDAASPQADAGVNSSHPHGNAQHEVQVGDEHQQALTLALPERDAFYEVEDPTPLEWAKELVRMHAERNDVVAARNTEMMRRIKEVTRHQSRTDNCIDDEAVGLARTRVAAEAATRRAAQRARIRRENAQYRQRLDTMGPKIDDDTEDDATGVARARLRAQSAASRRAAAAAMRAQNLTMRQRLESVQAVTDNKIWDDGVGSAGAARSIVAAESRRRRAEESRLLEDANDAYRRRINNAVAAVDDDITDDVAADGTVGAGRAEAAAASRARKAAEAAGLAAENRAMRDRIRSTGAAVDDDITDDVAADGTVGAGRAEAAAASRARKAAEAAGLAAENRAMRDRIRKIDAGGAVDELDITDAADAADGTTTGAGRAAVTAASRARHKVALEAKLGAETRVNRQRSAELQQRLKKSQAHHPGLTDQKTTPREPAAQPKMDAGGTPRSAAKRRPSMRAGAFCGHTGSVTSTARGATSGGATSARGAGSAHVSGARAGTSTSGAAASRPAEVVRGRRRDASAAAVRPGDAQRSVKAQGSSVQAQESTFAAHKESSEAQQESSSTAVEDASEVRVRITPLWTAWFP